MTRTGKDNPCYRHGHQVNGKPSCELSIYRTMLARCYNPNDRGYKNYGGRGIQVAEEWRKSFLSFFRHLGPRPSAKHSLDRINNDGNYEPGNVRWATRKQQNRNTRRTHFLSFDGISLSIRGWEDRLGFNLGTLDSRLRRGWTVKDALTTPLNSPRRRRRAA